MGLDSIKDRRIPASRSASPMLCKWNIRQSLAVFIHLCVDIMSPQQVHCQVVFLEKTSLVIFVGIAWAMTARINLLKTNMKTAKNIFYPQCGSASGSPRSRMPRPVTWPSQRMPSHELRPPGCVPNVDITATGCYSPPSAMTFPLRTRAGASGPLRQRHGCWAQFAVG